MSRSGQLAGSPDSRRPLLSIATGWSNPPDTYDRVPLENVKSARVGLRWICKVGRLMQIEVKRT